MALEPLATVADLAERLGIAAPAVGSVDYKVWLDAIVDASNEMRRVIGQPITAGEATLELDVDDRGHAWIPLCPVRDLSDVETEDGDPLAADTYRLRGQRLHVYGNTVCGRTVTATVAYGFPEIPGDILRYVYVLAAAQIAAKGRGNLGMTGGLENISVDDARAQLADAPVTLPDRIADQLRMLYGGGS